ncbi:MAG: molybdopterin-synthase adenylyltransferase MoeB [Rhodocyclaceae bacterium]|nr:molybdopterin-synthase adenylyltransferase MoeB [Rhodocyclaceae bacterium]
MTDEQLLRYSRHILLPQLSIEGHERIAASRALVVGAGGLGSPALLYLTSAGVGTIAFADHDNVDLTNLQRQIIHRTATIGQRKVDSAAQAMAAINPDCGLVPLPTRLEGALLASEIALADVVLDCSDNFATRHAINRACIAAKKPLVSGAVVRFDGQIAVFDPRRTESPCYHCLFPEGDEVEETRCAVTGVFAPLTGIIGSMQAAEALKLLAGTGSSLAGRLLLLDAFAMAWREVRVPRDPDCAICSPDSGPVKT